MSLIQRQPQIQSVGKACLHLLGASPHGVIRAREQPQAQAVQVVRHLPHSHALAEIQVLRADDFLNGLAA